MRSLLKRKEVFWALGFTTCLSLLVEEKVKYPNLLLQMFWLRIS